MGDTSIVTNRTLALMLINTLMQRGLQVQKQGDKWVVYDISTRIEVETFTSIDAVSRKYMPGVNYRINR